MSCACIIISWKALTMHLLLFWMMACCVALETRNEEHHQSAIDNVEECLECTEGGCLYCESEHQFTLYGQHFSMCNCNEQVLAEDYSPEPGYCGSVNSQFNRYAKIERQCINLNDIGKGQQESNNNGDAAMIALLAALIPIVCCIGFCTGCTAVYYVYILKQEAEEERRVRERTALMKVVTARQLHSSHDTSISTVEEDDEDEENRRVIT